MVLNRTSVVFKKFYERGVKSVKISFYCSAQKRDIRIRKFEP